MAHWAISFALANRSSQLLIRPYAPDLAIPLCRPVCAARARLCLGAAWTSGGGGHRGQASDTNGAGASFGAAGRRGWRHAKVEALRFLIHFVGDVHQPLHAADRRDKGGNDVKVRWHNKRLSLHQIWDQDVVTPLGDDFNRIAVKSDASLSPQQKQQMSAGTPADWANESLALAGREIYARLPDHGRVKLPDDYGFRESGVARLQLTKAGLRLAATLNRIYR